MSRRRDAGTVIPLLVLGFLLAGTVLAASVAGSAALVAHRRLAATCDGAALAGAAALDRAALDRPALDRAAPDRAGPDRARPDPTGLDRAGPGNPAGTGVLPLDPAGARARVQRYLAAQGSAVAATTSTTGGTVTVRCTRIARVPFEAVIAHPHGIREVATARAGAVPRPST